MTAETTVSASRERERLVMIRDAFHRQGPFLGSGGRYNPGPASRITVLDDAAAAGWHSRATLGLAPVLSRLGGEADSRLYLSPGASPTVSPADLAPG